MFTGGLPIGTEAEVKALLADSKQLETLREGDYAPQFGKKESTFNDETGVFVGQGILDHCLDTVESVASGVNSLLWMPFSLLAYPFMSETPTENKDTDDIDIDIVHTNWYWRNLKRRFRFTKQEILRIHPTHGDVRARHSYADIRSVKIVDDTQFVIYYRDDSPPDFVTATEEATATMFNIIKSRSFQQPVFLRESEI